MKITMWNGKPMEIKFVSVNGANYVLHQELKKLAREDEVMFDFPHIKTDATGVSAMCVVCRMDGTNYIRCYGTAQAPTMTLAVNLAYDNAMIELYSINARSYVEIEIARTAKKVAEGDVFSKAEGEAAAKEAVEEAVAAKVSETTTKNSYSHEDVRDWADCHSLTPDDSGDFVINCGPFKQTEDPTPQRPGPRYLSQVLRYCPSFVEKMISGKWPVSDQYIQQILMYCAHHDIGLHAITGIAHDKLVQYGVREL